MPRTVDNAPDWLIANLGTVMVNTTQYTHSPVLSRSHPSTQVKVARRINKHDIKP